MLGGMDDERRRLEQFRSWHDEAFLYINQAVTQEADDIGRPDVALLMYQRGLGLLDLALCVDTSGKGSAWAAARKKQEKMGVTRQHLEDRVRALTDQLAPPLPSTALTGGSNQNGESNPPPRPPPPTQLNGAPPCYDAPPSYHEAQATMGAHGEVMILGERGASESSNWSQSMQGEVAEVLLTMEGVQVFTVAANGEVSTPSYPETLHLIKFSGEGHGSAAPAFLEAGSWTYPLVRGRSPVLKTEYVNCYMFPSLEPVNDGGAVGLLVPASADQQLRDRLQSLLQELTSNALKTQEEVDLEYQQYREFSSNLANGLVKGSEVLGRGMVRGAVKGSELIFHGADYMKQYITPEAEAREVDPRLAQGLAAAAWVSKGACRVSGWLVGRVGEATMALGRLAAPHLERSANRALTHMTIQSSHESSNQLKIVGEVASGTVAAVSTMYIALENSSKILAKNIANNTVILVSHKYGTDMAAVTDSALSTAGNSYLTFYNAAALGPKGIAKRAAKDTGKAFIGVDVEAVAARASVVPDQQQLAVRDVLDSAGVGSSGSKHKSG